MTALLLCVLGWADPPAELVRDPRWQMAEGAAGHVVSEVARAFPDLAAFDDYQKCTRGRDADGMAALIRAGRVVKAPYAAPLVVVRRHKPPPPRVSLAGGDYATALQAAALRPHVVWPAEVRFTGGPLSGKLMVMAEDDVGRLKPDEPVVVPKKPAPKAVPDADRAATMLRSARALEAAGKTAGALALYRDAARRFPATPAGKAAAAAAARLTGTPPPASPSRRP